MANIPEGFGRVVGTLRRTVDIDGDGTPIPDAQVRFRAGPSRILAGNIIYGADSVHCTTDEDGVLLGPGGESGVLLLASDGDSQPSGFTWRVTVSSPTVAAQSWNIFIPEGETTDLFRAVPVPADPGSAVLEWVRAREEALAVIAEAADEVRRSLVSFFPTGVPGVVEARFPVDAVSDDPGVVNILIGEIA